MTGKQKKLSDQSSNSIAQFLSIALGIFWFVDGVLQFQPQMFTKSFATNVLAANLTGQPSFMVSLINFGIKIFMSNMLIVNGFSALVQVVIGIVLVVPALKRFRKAALYTSIVWAFIIWIFGEGLGNLLTGSASFYTGAPGSVVLYLILAVFLLFPNKFSLKNLPKVAGYLFLLGALLNTLPMFWTVSGMQMLYSTTTSDSINVIAQPAKYFLQIVSNSFVISNDIFILLLIYFGIQLLTKPKKSIAWCILVFLLITWWAGQDFGSIQTFPQGTATDPNSALLFVLFILPLFYKESWNFHFIKKIFIVRDVRQVIKHKARRSLAGILIVLFGISLVCVTPAFAHVIVTPDHVGIATVQEFQVTVPNEKNIPTVSVRLLMPPGLTDVIPNVEPNWTVASVHKGSSTSENNITEIDWTNGNLPVGQRIDFLFQAQVPPQPTTLDWKAYQTYANGEVVSWDRPPVTMINMSKMSDFTKFGPYSTTKIINDLSDQNVMNNANELNMSLGLSILATVLGAAGIFMQLRK